MSLPFGCSAVKSQYLYELVYNNKNNNSTSFDFNIYDIKNSPTTPVKINICVNNNNSNNFSYAACSIVGNTLYIVGNDKTKGTIIYEYRISPTTTVNTNCQSAQPITLQETDIFTSIGITPQYPSVSNDSNFIILGRNNQNQTIAEAYNNTTKTASYNIGAASSDLLPILITFNNLQLAIFEKSVVYLYELTANSAISNIPKIISSDTNNNVISNAPKIMRSLSSINQDIGISKRQEEPKPANSSNENFTVFKMTSNSLLSDQNTKLNAAPIQVGSSILLPVNDNMIVKINLLTVSPSSSSSNTANISVINVDDLNSNIQNPSINAITYDSTHTVYLSNLDSNKNIILYDVDQNVILSGRGSSDTSSNGVDNSNSNSVSLSTGAIVGIVIGCVVGIIIIGLIGFFIWRNKRKQNQKQQLQQINNQLGDNDIAMTDKIPSSYPYRSIPKDDTNDDTNNRNKKWLKHALSSGIIKPINNSSLPQNNDQYKPNTANEILIVGSDTYRLNSEPPIYSNFPQGHATRSAGEYTIHYFQQHHIFLFIRLVEVSKSLSIPSKKNSDHQISSVIKTIDAFALTTPVDHGYQYLWITSKYSLQHTLQYLLFNELNPTVDRTQFSFRVWSTLSLLNSLKRMHSYGWVHCKLNPYGYYFEQQSTITDWSLCSFYQSQPISSSKSTPSSSSNSSPTTVTSLSSSFFIPTKDTILELDEYSSPELIKQLQPNTTNIKISSKSIFTPSIDIWSLGCILYSLTTGKYSFQHLQEYQTLLSTNQLQSKIDTMLNEVAFVDESYKTLLSRMLQIDPFKRDHLTNLIAYWVDIHNLNDDDDDELDE